MVRYAYAFVAMAGLASALPLNINLGAYSPALVVGDGEISFGGEQDVSKLMNVLEGAAVNTAATVANNAANNAANGNTATSTTVNNEVPVPSAAGTTNAAASDPLVEQGLGNKKEIAPRMQLVDAADDEDDDGDDAAAVEKRDLAGFDRALTYAEAALTKGPKVQLGTGKEGSGVGIIVDNTPSTATAAKAAKRDVDGDASPKRSKRDETVPRSVSGIVVPPTAASVSRRDAIDAVNLNVDGDQGLTMTFVETVEDDDE
ncbi:hypothetical protein SPBR_00838 [Sporothrix brasiliensis 5110]|uniref:Uncharacterized protein n=1 Tax=Sporothrix brasiliensis 5110 TaxID=1398154 RepID=A0A0C2IVL2_9PEZI|nr:uncharacterized protein SPBR_00838 [Sporothrix brasiliensis 5110]KIH90835.1 hypothetical protein SPBR_00838 [Sporothrix brasiliensis 5110]